MSLFTELKRRNVIRVAVAYLVLSWFVLQVASVLVDALELPNLWTKTVVAVLVIGFIPVLVFSWVYELTPEGLKKESGVLREDSITVDTAKKLNITVIVLLVAAIGLFAIDRLLLDRVLEVAPTEATVGVDATEASTLAVTSPAPGAPRRIIQFSIPLPGPLEGYRPFAFSPDDARVVFSANDQLYLHSFDQGEPVPIPRTVGAEYPFFSPDSRSVGYNAYLINQLKSVSLGDGLHTTIWDFGPGFVLHYPSWGPEGKIVFNAGRRTGSGIFLKSLSGGAPRMLTSLDPELGELAHFRAQILPGGKTLLYTVYRGSTRPNQIVVQSLETGNRKNLFEVKRGYANYVRTGHLVYRDQERRLLAVSFDPTSLEMTGEPIIVTENVGSFSFSDQGSVAYSSYTGVTESTLVWVDREGNEEPLEGLRVSANDLHFLRWPRLSPDGSRLTMAASRGNENLDIWVFDMTRGITSRLTTHPATDYRPLWTSDGLRIAFSSNRDGQHNIYWKTADGMGKVERLTKSPNFQDADWFSPDMKTMIFWDDDPKTSGDIWMMSLEGERFAKPIIRTPANEGGARVSPNGKWIAYHSDESGQMEIYVRPFPDVENERWKISTNGGVAPLWGPDGQELFYSIIHKAIMVVQVETETGFRPGTPETLLEGDEIYRFGRSHDYEITSDGRRFLMNRRIPEADGPMPDEKLIIVLNRLDNL